MMSLCLQVILAEDTYSGNAKLVVIKVLRRQFGSVAHKVCRHSLTAHIGLYFVCDLPSLAPVQEQFKWMTSNMQQHSSHQTALSASSH